MGFMLLELTRVRDKVDHTHVNTLIGCVAPAPSLQNAHNIIKYIIMCFLVNVCIID